MTRKQITAVIVILTVFIILFGYFVWPTPWKTHFNEGKVTKMNRITGSVCVTSIKYQETTFKNNGAYVPSWQWRKEGSYRSYTYGSCW